MIRESMDLFESLSLVGSVIFKAVAKDHLKSLVRSSTCLVILDYFHFTPLVLIGKKIFFFLKLEARLEAVIFSYSLKG